LNFAKWALFSTALFREGMARPLSQVMNNSTDTFPCSTQASQDHSKVALLGISISKKDLASPDPGCLAGYPPHFSQRDISTSGRKLKNCIFFEKETHFKNPAVSGVSNMLTRLALQLFLVKGFKLYSFQLQKPNGLASLFIVTTSLYQDWVICAPAAFLGCGGHFSCPLSGIEP
jgi:hypothetical protein